MRDFTIAFWTVLVLAMGAVITLLTYLATGS